MTRNRYFVAVAIGFAIAVSAAPAFGGEYRLGVSDRLRVKVQEWPDLNGEYSVNADGAVSLPLVGEIRAAGIGIKDLAKDISDRLQRRSGGTERPFAAVEILQFRPFAILGDVQRPGEYPYRPGLRVIQAISLAGGYYRPTDPGLLRLGRDIAMAKGDINSFTLKQAQLIARTARLTAALAGHDDLAPPPELAAQADDPEIVAIIDRERAALAVERKTAKSEQAALEEIRSLYQREIESLRGQIEAEKQQQATVQQQLKEINSLSAKGLALSATQLSLERTLAQVVNERMGTETSIVRAQENITLAEQRVREQALERDRRNERDLQNAKADLVEVRSRLETANDLLTEAQINAPAEARERLMELPRARTTVLRKNGDSTREFEADDATLVEPDDIIKVPMGRPRPVATVGQSVAAQR